MSLNDKRRKEEREGVKRQWVPGRGIWINLCVLERFSYDLEMKAREQNRNDKRTEIERFDWFIERTDKRAWLFIG